MNRFRTIVLGSSLYRLSLGRAHVATSAHSRRTGAVFDIDGVVLRGKNVLPGAREGLRLLQAKNIPYVFLTNGGGVLEAKKAAELSSYLGMSVVGEQVICSHSPFQVEAQRYKNDRVLVLGCRDVANVARTYGFRRPVTPAMLAADEPSRYPFFDWQRQTLPDRNEPIKAVFIMHDPVHWAVDLQVTLDAIRGGTPMGAGRKQAIPVYASNPDAVFAGVYPVPRLACGAFQSCLAHLFKELTGHELQLTRVGKPLKRTFDFAERTLERWASGAGASDKRHGDGSAGFSSIFMVGDNPKADIRGANMAGGPWHSVLVRTGVFSGPPGSNDAADPAEHVVEGIGEACEIIVEHADAMKQDTIR